MSWKVQAQDQVLIPIVHHQVFFLESRSSAIFIGNNSTVFELKLPTNTVRWYYRFYNVNKKELVDKYNPKVSFLEDLSSKMENVNFYNLKSPVIPSDYTNRLNVYLLNDSSQIEVFNKQFTLSKVEFQKPYSFTNTSSAWAEVCDPQFTDGVQYLGFLNTGTLTSTHVVLDVVAVCKKRTIDESGWDESDLKQIEFELVDNMAFQKNISPFLYKDIVNCYLESLQQQIRYDEFQSLSVSNKKSFTAKLFDNCYSDLYKVSENDTISDIDPYFIVGKWQTEKGEILEFKSSHELILKKKDASVLKGNWFISNQEIVVKFENFSTQKYQPILMSPQKYIWKNSSTGNYLRYVRVTP